MNEYRLRFYNTHTNERLDIVYRRGESYLPETLSLDSTAIFATPLPERCIIFDRQPFDLRYDFTAPLSDAGGEIDVIWGYRTRETNEFLRPRGANSGVAVASTCRRRPSTSLYRACDFSRVWTRP